MMSSRYTWVPRSLAVGIFLFWLAACGSSTTDGGSGSGGATGSGGGSGSSGAASGGTGGQSTGGASTTGAGTGGTQQGGSGGSATGATGGASTGGSGALGGSGGAATGGAGGGSGDGGGGGGNTEPCTGTGTLEAGDSSHSLTVGGNTYPMNVHAPPSYDGVTRLPVVFDFHGLGGNENQMRNLSGWASAGDAEGFITVFPGGVDNAWNAGGCCSDTPTDVDFVREAITYLDGEGCIDTRRVYASGCSNGGAMSFRLACEAADVIAAVAPVDFDCVAGGFGCQCDPGRPVTEIQFRGTNDSAVPYGETEDSGARANFATWGEINMCTGEPEPLPENSSCQRFPMCADGVETILCTVQNGNHCGSYMSFGIASLAWEIISRYSLP